MTIISIYMITSIVIVITSYILGYKKGKQATENKIIKNNNNLKKKYADNRQNNKKAYLNNSNSLSDKLQNGDY